MISVCGVYGWALTCYSLGFTTLSLHLSLWLPVSLSSPWALWSLCLSESLISVSPAPSAAWGRGTLLRPLSFPLHDLGADGRPRLHPVIAQPGPWPHDPGLHPSCPPSGLPTPSHLSATLPHLSAPRTFLPWAQGPLVLLLRNCRWLHFCLPPTLHRGAEPFTVITCGCHTPLPALLGCLPVSLPARSPSASPPRVL